MKVWLARRKNGATLIFSGDTRPRWSDCGCCYGTGGGTLVQYGSNILVLCREAGIRIPRRGATGGPYHLRLVPKPKGAKP